MKRILLLLSITFPVSVFSYDIATVIKEKAIIYKNRELTRPVGFLKKGRMVQTIKSKILYNKILPIIILLKRYYININDVQFIAYSPKIPHKFREHDLDIPFEDDWSQNHFISLTGLIFSPGRQWREIERASNEVKAKPLMGAHLNFRLFSQSRRLTPGIHIGKYSLKNFYTSIDMWEIGLDLYINILRIEWISFDLKFSGLYSPKLIVDPSLSSEKMYGYRGGFQIHLFPHLRWGLVGGLYFTRMICGEIDNTPLILSGMTYYAGLSLAI